MKTVFLYAGQGSQRVGMGQDFYDRYETFRKFIDECDANNPEIGIKKMMFEGPIEELSKTQNTQACMAAFAAGVTKLLEEKNIKPEIACGLSLGEYGALYAAGVFSADEYVKLTAFRGAKMAEAAKGIDCAMSAILGAESDLVERACAEYDGEGYVTATNYNCPGQYVICGDEVAVAAVEEKVKEMGARKCKRIAVTGPFHTKYMKPAGDNLAEYFSKMDFAKPQIPVLCNVTGDYLKPDEDLKEMLVRQVQNGVRMEAELRKLIADGVDHFVEIGPGEVLSGFVKRTARAMGAEVWFDSIDTAEDFEEITSYLLAQ
ncbi:MAG: ACP S-malonyltransferase [Lachnospiraceae bacterium]|nr:ACP S-malonyltransferase [Lachnospiraceae bacterium]